MILKFKLESDVDDYVKDRLLRLGLVKRKDYNEKSAMSDYMKVALKGSAKTKEKSNFGMPDFHIEKYSTPVIIENKLGIKNHISENKAGIKLDFVSVKNYAVKHDMIKAIYWYKKVAADGEENAMFILDKINTE